MNYTLLFSIFTIIAVVSIIFSISMSVYITAYDSDWYGLFSKDVSDNLKKEKIFLLGSSTVYSVNSTLLNHHFIKNEINYEFFNLADMADTPKKRIHSLSNIISNEPNIVIYGLDIANFRVENKHPISPEEIILHPQNFFLYHFDDFMEPIRDKIPGSPKDRSLLTLKYFLFGPQPHHHPFINFYETSVTPMNELKQNFSNYTPQKLDLSNNNEEITSLKKIMNELKKNNIKLIIFSAPKLINEVSDNDIRYFKQTLLNYSQEYDIPVYFLHDEYMDLEIWRDSQHVAINNDTQIYTKDILEILLKEMK
tara:strand:+ start:579 stop:1505 length:927 start_codon:yes stop_codon:yes gene_type:complete